MGLKLPDNIAYGGHRTIKVSGDGLVALKLSMLGYNLVSDLLRQFSGFLSFLHAHCGAYSDTKQQNDSFSRFKLELNSPVVSCRCLQYINHSFNQFEWRKRSHSAVLCHCVYDNEHGEKKENQRIVCGGQRQDCRQTWTISQLQVHLQRP